MVLTTILCKCWKATSRTESKEQKLMMHIVLWNFVRSSTRLDIRPLLFNIYICDLFYDTDDCYIASYVDDNTPYASSSNLDALINKPEESTTAYFSGLEIITWRVMLTNATFWLQGTMKSLQILMNLKLKAGKKKNYLVYQLTLHFLLSIILHLCKKAS